MRIFLLLITVGLSAAFANSSYSQAKMDISVNNVTIEQLFEEIQSASEYVFFYKNKSIDTEVKVTLQMHEMTLAAILDKAFFGTDLTYIVNGRQVVVKKADATANQKTASIVATSMNQGFEITGTVVGTDGSVLPGATVIEKGTNNGAVTDFDGQFSLTVGSKNAILVVTYIGYKTYEQSIEGQASVTITLLEDQQNLEEVVVIGYGTVKKSDLTGSVSSVKGEVMEMTPISTLEQGLQGRMAGVNITSATGEPGAGMNIIVRGASSISGGNQPLYVIDGIPFFNNSADLAGDFENADASNNLNPMSSLNPNDIESIEVLKDASSTGIYGSRGANGVIMITTKQGKAGKGRINVDFKSSYSLLPETIDLVNAQQHAILTNEYKTYVGEPIIYDGEYHESNNGGPAAYFPTPDEIPGLMGEGTDWQKEIMRNATSNDLNVRMSGGTKDVRYNVAGGFLDTEGLLINTSFNRYSLRGNLNAQLNDVVKLTWNADGSAVQSNRSNTNTSRFDSGGAERSGVIVKAFMASPVMRVDETWFNDEIDNSNGDFGTFNPVVDLTDQYYYKKNFNVSTNLRLDFKISDELSFVTRGGIRYIHDRQDRYWNQNTSQGFRANGKSLYNSALVQNLVNENYFTYTTKVQDHHINLVGGMSIEKKTREGHTYGFQDYSLDFQNGLFYDAYASGQDPVMPVTTKAESKLLSIYGRLSYNYDGRYYFTGTFRGDASSVFAENNKWALFPSAGLGWNLHKEDFMADIDWISNTKLRGSYGLSGNQAIAPYQSLPSLGTDNFSFVDGRALGVFPAVPGNVDLTWETTTQIDAGIDLGFLKNKYSLTFDYYKKTTHDLLLNMPVLAQSGFSSILSNFGNIVNEGYEVEATLTPVRKRDLRWTVDMNWSTNKATISELNNVEFIDFYTNVGGGRWPTHRLEEGGRIGNFFGFESDGLLTQEDIDNGYPTLGAADDVGEMKFVDRNGDGAISLEDGKVLGNAYPDHIFGINNSLTYKRFTLSFLIRGAVGQEVLNMMRVKTHLGAGLRGVAGADYYDNRWTPENPDGIYPRYTGNTPGISDWLIEDGSYVRLQNVTLNYKIPQNISWMRNAELYLTGFNLYTWHNYSGYDPEVSSYGQNLLRGGVDRGSYPRTTTFTLGVRIGL